MNEKVFYKFFNYPTPFRQKYLNFNIESNHLFFSSHNYNFRQLHPALLPCRQRGKTRPLHRPHPLQNQKLKNYLQTGKLQRMGKGRHTIITQEPGRWILFWLKKISYEKKLIVWSSV